MDRREFVEASALAAAGVTLASSCALAEENRAAMGRSLDRIGVQLYTVRDRMQDSVPHTLSQVAEIGYHELEFAGYFGHSPVEIREFLDEFGLAAPASHIPMDAVRTAPDDLIDMARTIGHRYLVVASIAQAERTLDGYRRVAEEFNEFGERCQAADLQFAYHNHDFEFEQVDGEIAYDVLLAECDANLVKMELDLFWIRKGGQDPLPYFERHPSRFELCHVKDMDRGENMVDVGAGIIDFAAVFAQSENAGLRHYFVEHDTPGDSLASIERSFGHLAALTF